MLAALGGAVFSSYPSRIALGSYFAPARGAEHFSQGAHRDIVMLHPKVLDGERP